MRYPALVIAFVLLATLFGACSGDERDELILYEASDGSVTNVFAANPVTAEVTQLTAGSSFDGNPAWSPDRKRIVFSSRRDGQAENDLYVMNADGRNARRLTDTPGDREFSAKFSPDGESLAYVIDEAGDEWSVWVSRADGSKAERVAGGYAFAEFPAWTPDGRELYYSAIEEEAITGAGSDEYGAEGFGATGGGGADIYSIDIETRAVRTRLSTPGRDVCPHISSDGETLFYASTRSVGGETLAIFAHDIASDDVSGSGDTALTDSAFRSDYPGPSPDGKRIAFTTDRDGNTELYVMNADGTDQRRITTTPEMRENVPHW